MSRPVQVHNHTRGGIGLAGALGLLFVALKLTGHIAWPWLWVTAPFWIPLALVVLVFVAAFLIVLIVACCTQNKAGSMHRNRLWRTGK